MEVLTGVLRGMGYSIIPMIMSFLGACVFRIVWVYTVFEVWHTLDVLYISYPVSWALTAAAHLCTYFIVYKRLMKRVRAAEAVSSVDAERLSPLGDGTEPPSEELPDVFGAEAGDALAGPMDDVTEENTDENEYKTG